MTEAATTQAVEIQDKNEEAEARSEFRLERALEAFAHASRAAINNPVCPRCISANGQWRGYRTRAKDQQIIHRRRCNTCTRWYGKPYR